MKLSHVPFFKTILEFGTKKEMGFIEEQKTKMFNLFILMAFPIALISFILNILRREYTLAALNFAQVVIFSLGVWTNLSGKHLYLRSIYMFALALIVFWGAYFLKNSSEYRLLIGMLAAIVIFDNDWQYLLFALIISAAFTFIRIGDIYVPGIAHQSLFLEVLRIALPLIFLNISLYYFKYIYFKNQIRLEAAFKELSIAKDQKDKILYTVAHDLRSPVSSVAAISKLLLKDDNYTAEQKEWLRYIESASINSNDLINDLLDSNDTFVKEEDRKDVDLNNLVKQSVYLMHFKALEKNIELKTELFSQPLLAHIDSKKMKRVFTNLIQNAIKFSSKNSTILIRVYLEGDNAVVTVKDSGVGIAKDQQQLIFNMFTTAKRIGTAGEKSFGLGLSICKKIVEQHSGTISLVSELGKGSEFKVSLSVCSPVIA